MAAQFLNYWTPETATYELETAGAEPRDHTATNSRTRLRPGDVLWIATAWPGSRLALLARLPVGVVTDRPTAIALLGRDDLHEARIHVIAPDGAAEPMRNIDLSGITAELRFEAPNDRLEVLSEGRISPTQLQSMRRLTPATVELLETVWRQAPDLEKPGEQASNGWERWYTEAEYREALASVAPEISILQRRMLVAHAEAPDRMLSVRQLAAAARYGKPQVTYAQYGRLGYLLAEALGYPNQMWVWTRIIGDDWRTQDGELIWEMHPELAHALVALGWASRAGAPDIMADLSAAEPPATDDGAEDPRTTREALVQARLGQGPFRAELLRFWGSCAVTGVSEPAVLHASHIKPWRDASNAERLDTSNGLLLVAHLDALFDAGLVTFADGGGMLLSPLLAPEDRAQLGLTGTMRLRHIAPGHLPYLAHHRAQVFRPRGHAA